MSATNTPATITSATTSEIPSVERMTEILVAETRKMNIAALNGMYSHYYKQAEDFINILEDNMRKSANDEKLSASLNVAYISCDLLRFHLERFMERLLPAKSSYADGSAEPITLPYVKNLMAESNKIIKRQREVEAKLKDRGILVDPKIVPRSQHRPLL